MDRHPQKKGTAPKAANVSKIASGVASMKVAERPAAIDKFAVGRERMQKLLQNGAFSNVPNPMTKFPKLVVAGASKKASRTVTAGTHAAVKQASSAPALASQPPAILAKKVAPVTASKASVKAAKASVKK